MLQAGTYLGRACDEADESLLHLLLRHPVCIYAKETHAILRPQVTYDADLDAPLEAPNQKVPGVGFALGAEHTEVVGKGVLERQLITQPRLAKLEYTCQQLPQLDVRCDALRPPALSDPTRHEPMKLVCLLLAEVRLRFILLGGKCALDHGLTAARAVRLDVQPFFRVVLFEVPNVPTRAGTSLGRREALPRWVFRVW